MKALLVTPHADDETLFASHIVAKYNPEIAIVYLPRPAEEREIRLSEFQRAVACLTWPVISRWAGGWEGATFTGLVGVFRAYKAEGFDYVFAPAPIQHGHVEHNEVGRAAIAVWDKRTLYHTYTRTGGRVRRDREALFTSVMIQAKLRALAEYRSQIDHPARRPWFFEQLDLREWWTE